MVNHSQWAVDGLYCMLGSLGNSTLLQAVDQS